MSDFDQAARFAARRLDPPGILHWIPVSADLVAVVEAETNLDTLNAWFRRALTAANLSEVRATLGLNGA